MKCFFLFAALFLGFLAAVPAISAESAAAGDQTVVIVLKDAGFAEKLAGLVQAESAAQLHDPSAAAAEIAPPGDVEERLSAIWQSFKLWFDNHKIHLLVLAAGLTLTYAVAWVLNWVVWSTILRLCRRTRFRYDDIICEKMRAPSMLLLCSVGVFLSAFTLSRTLGADAMIVWKRGFAMMIAISFIWGIFRLIDILDRFLQEIATRDSNNANSLLADLVRKTLKVVLLMLSIFFIGQSILGLNITALLAGAGVAGLAVAFAAQDTLANFFGSITIILDKPFAIGDRVKMNTVDAIVEGMGLRSTRLRGLDGNLYTVPNRQFADNVIENVTRRPFIKESFSIGLVYETTTEQMAEAKKILTEILNRPDFFDMAVNPPRVAFASFGAYSLNLSVVLWFNTQDYFESRQQLDWINAQILERFNQAKLGFAFPSQTIYMSK